MLFDWKLLLTLIVGLLLRYLLLVFDVTKSLERKIEITSPLTSWFRIKECIHLSQHGLSPYSGDICHQPPLLIALFLKIPDKMVSLFFIIVDICITVVLYTTACSVTKSQMERQKNEKKIYAKNVTEILLKETDIQHVPLAVASMYFLLPYTIITTTAQSTLLVNHFFSALFLMAMANFWFLTASVFVAVMMYLSLYPAVLLLPLLLTVYYKDKCVLDIVKCFVMFVVTMTILLYQSHSVFKSWDFINSVYGFILLPDDLTPNMGLYWYFFLEMFDHFKLFFITVFQLSIFVYSLPVVVVFRKHSILMCYILLSLITLFKVYSNFGDLSLPLAMLPLWMHVYRYSRNVLLIFFMGMVCSVLAPVMYYLWMYAGSGNANFFYAVTLAHAASQVFLLSDVCYAFLRREFHLEHGMNPLTVDGKEGEVKLS